MSDKTSDAKERGWLRSETPVLPVFPASTPAPKTAQRFGKTQTQALHGRWFVGQMRKAKQDETKTV